MDDLRKCALIITSAMISVLVGLGSGCSAPSASVNSGDVDQLAATREINQQQETLALAKSMYMKLINDGAGVRGALDELRHLNGQWETDILPLLQSNDGKFLAADGESVGAFREHFGTVQPVPKGTIEQLELELSTLLAPIDSAVKSGTVASTPDPQFAPMLAEISSKVQNAVLPYKEAVPALQALAAKAKSKGVSGEKTLQQALDELIHADVLTRAERIEAARKETEAAMTEKMAQAEQELVRAKREQEIQAAKDEAARVDSQTEADTLTAKANNPDTLKRLEPFVTKGNFVLEQSSRQYIWRRSETEPLPLSFKAITLRSALEPTENGLKSLMGIALDPNNDRPAWARAASQKDWDWIRENQKLLKELGPTLVSLGHLAP